MTTAQSRMICRNCGHRWRLRRLNCDGHAACPACFMVAPLPAITIPVGQALLILGPATIPALPPDDEIGCEAFAIGDLHDILASLMAAIAKAQAFEPGPSIEQIGRAIADVRAEPKGE